MPELAELAIMSDFINEVSRDATFHKIRKSDVSKVKTDLSKLEFEKFKISSESRGKEILLRIRDQREELQMGLLVTMGMSGNWGSSDGVVPKHSHLIFEGVNGRGKSLTLFLQDVRRFAKWSWKENFSQNRGPCPVKQHSEFRQKFQNNLQKSSKKLVAIPILDIIMNQEIFNGIGNYLRAEIFDRANVNPFKTLSEISNQEVEKILDYCRICPSEAYLLGGGQLKDWKNSFVVEAKSFLEWRKVYGVGEKIQDRAGRMFWFDPKWKETEEYKRYLNANRPNN